MQTDTERTTAKMLNMRWVMTKVVSVPGVLIIGVLVLLVWVLYPTTPETDDETTSENNAASIITTSVTAVEEVPPPQEPSFVTMTGGEVTMPAEQAQFIVLTIVQQVELRPFLYGLTPKERAVTVEGYIQSFNEALVSGDPTNPALQKAALYENGAALQEAARSGEPTAQEAINQYVEAFKDDLSYIGPENVGSAELVLAIVALDALGQPEMAAAYVQQVFDERDALAKTSLVNDLADQGLQPDQLPEGFVKNSPGTNPQSEPQTSSMPETETGNETNAATSPEMGEPHQTGNLHVIPPMVELQPMVGGLGIAPYNWVIFAQWGMRALQGHQLNDTYTLESVNVQEIVVFDRTFYYVQLQILRQRDNGSEKSFPFVALAGNVDVLTEGAPIEYKTLSDLADYTLQRLKEGTQ